MVSVEGGVSAGLAVQPKAGTPTLPAPVFSSSTRPSNVWPRLRSTRTSPVPVDATVSMRLPSTS